MFGDENKFPYVTIQAHFVIITEDHCSVYACDFSSFGFDVHPKKLDKGKQISIGHYSSSFSSNYYRPMQCLRLPFFIFWCLFGFGQAETPFMDGCCIMGMYGKFHQCKENSIIHFFCSNLISYSSHIHTRSKRAHIL